jgi:hypothetical protein
VRLNVVVVACALGACRPPTLLVADVRVVGSDLVIERCPIYESALTSCQVHRVRVPVTAADGIPHSPRPSPDREAALARIGKQRSELAACAAQAGLHGVIDFKLGLDAAGSVTAVAPAPLADCVKLALGPERFAVSMLETQLVFSLVAPEPAP